MSLRAHEAGHGLTEELLAHAKHQQRLAGGGSASGHGVRNALKETPDVGNSAPDMHSAVEGGCPLF
jgi:hypothetical protein